MPNMRNETRLTIEITPALRRALRVRAAELGLSMRRLVTDLILAALEAKKPHA